tara:strand:- start:210 stop:1988 length:1779 start_codon:yes stop_codon:yes gene_type:complete
MKYPKEYLDEIKLRLKVSQVVGKTVSLKKRGKEFIGLSPFKNEKSPSFTVSDEKEFYHCFSTGEHGNIFDFLMKTKGVGFGEAVKDLAAEAGMSPYRFSNFDEKKEKKFKIYKSIYKEYSEFFNKELFNENNKDALQYLEKRKINKKIIEEFNLGFVPWKNNFYNDLLKKYNEDEIISTGLYYKHDKSGKFIDRFNSRIIFPINNLGGETIAFGGRIIKESKFAKYINSPETEYYKKGKMIFNLDKAKSFRASTNEVIVVEGYMDVISLYSAGIKNVISNSGTALTENQVELIWKFFSNPIICLDGDESGQKAAERIAERFFPLLNENNKIYFSILSEGQDPDDFIKKYGKEKFLSFINEKEIIQNFIWKINLAKINFNNPYEISKFEKDIKKLCFTIKDETLKKYIQEDFYNKIAMLTPSRNYKNIPFNYKKKNTNMLNETKNIHKQKSKYSKEILKEFSILYIMINFPSVIENKIESISEITFDSVENETLKKDLIAIALDGSTSSQSLNSKLQKHEILVKEIFLNNNIKIILNKKKDDEVSEILLEIMDEIKEIKQNKKIESLESRLINNLDEQSYLELIKLKSQLNRE